VPCAHVGTVGAITSGLRAAWRAAPRIATSRPTRTACVRTVSLHEPPPVPHTDQGPRDGCALAGVSLPLRKSNIGAKRQAFPLEQTLYFVEPPIPNSGAVRGSVLDVPRASGNPRYQGPEETSGRTGDVVPRTYFTDRIIENRGHHLCTGVETSGPTPPPTSPAASEMGTTRAARGMAPCPRRMARSREVESHSLHAINTVSSPNGIGKPFPIFPSRRERGPRYFLMVSKRRGPHDFFSSRSETRS